MNSGRVTAAEPGSASGEPRQEREDDNDRLTSPIYL